uniref:VENN motif pre-toxin domain-containing protein n=1 Tax=Escherichia coli TaxID=562 RepID=UPI0002B959CE
VQGLAGGNLSAALAGGAAPYIAEIIKQTTPDGAGRVAAHAVVNAALAVAQGKNALAGAAGAATGEVVGMIATQMYGKPVSELSETEKQTVSTLATVAAGLAGGLVGDSGVSAVAGAQSGKTTVENNALSFGDGFESNAAAATSWNKYAVDNNLTPEQTQAGLDKIAKGDMPDSTNITKVIVDGYQDGVMIAGAWYLGPAASAGKVLGGGLLGLAANSGYQVYDLNQPQNANKSWDYLGSATSFTTGMMAPGRGVLANTGIAMGGAFFTDGPNTASLAGAGIGAGLGGAFGKYAPTAVGKILGNDPVPGFIYGFGTGGKYQQAIQAATAAVQGLAGGNLSAALAGGAAPYIAEIIKQTTPDGAGRVAAHAVVNAALAVAQGKNALAGAAGAATGEVVGMIATQMYGKPVSELSETEKQTVSTLATVAAGLAGGLVGDSGVSAVAGAQSGKTTVENNALSFGDGFESNAAAATSWNKYAVDNNLTPEQTQAGLDKIAKGDMPDSTNITKVIVDGYQDGVMIAGAWYLGPAASAGKVLGGGLLGLAANSGYQVYDLNQPQNANKSWDYLGSATSFTTGMMAPGRGVLANTGIAMGGAFFTDGPNTASLAGAGIGAGLGGAFGKYAPTAVGKILGNDPVPGFIYELGGGAVSEFTNGIIKDFNNPQVPEKKENK